MNTYEITGHFSFRFSAGDAEEARQIGIEVVDDIEAISDTYGASEVNVGTSVATVFEQLTLFDLEDNSDQSVAA